MSKQVQTPSELVGRRPLPLHVPFRLREPAWVATTLLFSSWGAGAAIVWRSGEPLAAAGLFFPVLVVAVPCFVRQGRYARQRDWADAGRCVGSRYDLRVPSIACPECGWPADADA